MNTIQQKPTVDPFTLGLVSQPKSTITAYMKHHGILTPRVYDTLSDALASGKKIVARSEHWQDYMGASGLSRSIFLSKEIIEKAQVDLTPELNQPWSIFNEHPAFEEVVKKHDSLIEIDKLNDLLIANASKISQKDFEQCIIRLDARDIEQFCKWQGLNLQEFYNDSSLSYWEYIDGWNRKIVADSSISKRYHILTRPEWNSPSYLIVDNDTLTEGAKDLPPELIQQVKKTIDFYESIRSLLDPNHCTLVEFQTTKNGDNYFLQALRTRVFSESKFDIRDIDTSNMQPCTYVRGATPKTGMLLNTSTFYPQEIRQKPLPHEDASFDRVVSDRLFMELMTKKRKVQFLDGDFGDIAFGITNQHLPTSKLFKPATSAGVKFGALLSKDARNILQANPGIKIPILFISDGRSAFVKVEK